jgi:hypothetical protein
MPDSEGVDTTKVTGIEQNRLLNKKKESRVDYNKRSNPHKKIKVISKISLFFILTPP